MIACSPSTGSSLLRRLLNRHSYIFCGSETHILAKEDLYLDWNKASKKLIASFPSGLKDKAWVHFRGVLLDEEYKIDQGDLKNIVALAASMEQFVEKLSQIILERENKKLWIEKTPSNALCAENFLDTIPDARLIHITRQPHDVVCSLMNRGLSLYEAACRYLINTSYLAKLADHKRSYLIRYEDLVMQPREELSRLLEFLGLEFEESILLQQGDEKGIAHMKGWTYKETAKVEKGSVNKFELLDAKRQSEICTMLEYLKFKDESLPSFQDICQRFNYTLRPNKTKQKTLLEAKRTMMKDRIMRSLSFRYFNHFNYPFFIE